MALRRFIGTTARLGARGLASFSKVGIQTEVRQTITWTEDELERASRHPDMNPFADRAKYQAYLNAEKQAADARLRSYDIVQENPNAFADESVPTFKRR